MFTRSVILTSILLAALARSGGRRATTRKKATAQPVVILPAGRAGFTIAEVAESLAISKAQVYLMLERGEFTSFHIGRAHRITADSLSDYISRQIAAEAV